MITNPIVAAAIDSLSGRVNKSTGISHPSDRDAAITLFKILKENGTFYKPDEIRAYLVSKHSWNTKDADQVAKVATDILDNKRLRHGRGGWKPEIYDIWVKRAEEGRGVV